MKKKKKTILDEINRRKLADAPQPVPPKPPKPPGPPLRVQTQTTMAYPQTLLLGGLFSGPPVLYLGFDASLGTNDGQISITPGGQLIDWNSKAGGAALVGVVAPIAKNVAVSFAARFVHSTANTVRLNNPGGTSVATGGSNKINAIVGEFSALFRFLNSLTLRASGYFGRAERNINLIINGASALNFSDTVNASGFGFGVGVPATVLGINVPGLCFNGGVDFMHYGEANGLTPALAPISLGGINDTRAKVGMTFFFARPADAVLDLESYQTCP